MKDDYFSYDVIICTYNGSKYIKEQLESILNQRILPSYIIISDDGSVDETLSVARVTLEEYQYSKYKIINGPQRGVTHNFLSALAYSSSRFTFLSDQDDIWHTDKVALFMESICQYDDGEIPRLFFSDAQLVSATKTLIAPSFLAYQGITIDVLKDDSILYTNCVQGASCCFNATLRDFVVNILHEVRVSHLCMYDWWIAILAKYYGQCHFISSPTLAYRQHGENVVGVFDERMKFLHYTKHSFRYLKSFFLAIKQKNELEALQKKHPCLRLSCRRQRSYRYIPYFKRIIIKWLNQ